MRAGNEQGDGIRNISQNCIDLVKKFEGLYLKAYKDPVGIWTIGYGTTGSVDGQFIGEGMVITRKKAEELLANDLKRFEAHVMKYDKTYHWNQNELDALTSFAYNVGNINQLTANGTRTKDAIARAILLYNKAGGNVLPGLTKRRAAERDLFLKEYKMVQKAPEEVDDEMVEKIQMTVNGKEVTVERILKNGTNYIKIRDIANALGLNVSSNGNIPVLSTKK